MIFDESFVFPTSDDDVFLRLEHPDTGATAAVITAPRDILGEDGPIVHQFDGNQFCVVFADEFIIEILTRDVELSHAEIKVDRDIGSDNDSAALVGVVEAMIRQGRIVSLATEAIEKFLRL